MKHPFLTTHVLPKIIFFLLFIVPSLVLQLAAQTVEVQQLTTVVQTYLPTYIVLLLVGKILGVVYPPIPGGVFTMASIPLIGWKLAYLIDLIGSTIGVSVAYYLGQKYGHTILRRVLGQKITNKVAATKLKQQNQIEAAIFLRFAAGGMLSDGLAWGASLIGFRYLPFMIGYSISHVITTLPVFYFVAVSISFNSWVMVALVAVTAWLIIYKFKGRYFE